MVGSTAVRWPRRPALVLVSLLVLAALLLPAASPAAASPSSGYGVPPYVQALTNVNIRSGPGTGYPAIGVLYAGQIAYVTSLSGGGGWYQIACQSNGAVTCWVTASARYTRPLYSLDQGAWPQPHPCPGYPPSCTPPVQPPPPPPPPCPGYPPSCTPPVSQVQALRVVNVRSGPGMGYAVIGQLAPWQVVQVTGVSGDGHWYRIVCPFYCSTACWVSAESWLTRPVQSWGY